MNLRRGFSLIEVLIAVVALAIGLLGLAAVFPVIVGQQRDASNSAAGESYTRSVRAFLNAYEPLDNPARGWARLRTLLEQSSLGEWNFDELYGGPSGSDVTWNSSSGPNIVIPARERLWPTESARTAGPRLIWDAVAFVPNVNPNDPPEPMLVAIFVRPVDGSIRDRADRSRTPWSLIDAQDRVPIGESNNRPTNDGSGNYASLFEVDMRIIDLPGGTRNGFEITGDGARTRVDAEAVLGRVGQRIVDRQGNVYRVTGSRRSAAGANTPLQLRISPPVPAGLNANDMNPCVVSAVAPVADPIILEINP